MSIVVANSSNGASGASSAPNGNASTQPVLLTITHEQKAVTFRIQDGRVELEPPHPAARSLGKSPRRKSRR